MSITLIIGFFAGWLIFFNPGTASHEGHDHEEQIENDQTIWTCSMHPQIKQDAPGSCPICGMDLVPLESSEDDISEEEIQMSESAVQLANIQTTMVTRGVPEKTVSMLGRVQPDERNIAQLTARFGGRIEKLYINYKGQDVYKGQKLATIYSPELITAQKELLEAVQLKESNPTYYKAAVSKLKLWDLTDEQINGIIENSEPRLYFDIQSPMTGTVTQRHVALGDYVKEGDALFEVIDLTRVWIMFEAYETDLPWIKKGEEISFTIQSMPGKVYQGKITYIDPFIDTETRIAQIRVELSNKDQEIKPGMFANGILQAEIQENIDKPLIPKSAILWTGKRAVVYVKVPGRESTSFVYREISLGPEAGNFYIVESGLAEGEEIATNGVFKIDAAAQLAGKPSMMNPEGTGRVPKHQHNHVHAEQAQHQQEQANLRHKEFRVAGNCNMCKKRIEEAAHSVEGVNSAVWNVETKIIRVSFNAEKTRLESIHQAIADAGYETELKEADPVAYNDLPECCLYKE